MKSLSVLSILLVLIGSAWAQVAPYPDMTVSNDVAQDVRKFHAAKVILDANQGESGRLGKQMQVLGDNVTIRADQVKRLHQKRDATVDNYNKIVQDYHAKGCGNDRTFVLPAEKAAYERCEQMLAESKKRAAPLAAEEQKLMAEIRQMGEQVKSDEQQMVQLQARIQKLANWREEVMPPYRALSEAILSRCQRMPADSSMEELKHCGNVDFDKANKALPPCTTEACRKAREIIR